MSSTEVSHTAFVSELKRIDNKRVEKAFPTSIIIIMEFIHNIKHLPTCNTAQQRQCDKNTPFQKKNHLLSERETAFLVCLASKLPLKK